MEPITITGVITKITHYKAPFFIGAIKAYGHEVTVLGNVDSPPSKGSEVQLTGKYKKHPSFGEQFSFWSIVEKMPDINDKKGIIRILTDKCKGIGPKKAEKLYKELGENTLQKISDSPHLFVDILKLPKDKAIANSQLIRHLIVSDEIRVPLLAWGLSPGIIDRVNTYFGDKAKDIISKEPYQLVCIKGIGFSTLDKILIERKLVTPNSPQRGMAICYHILKEAINTNGHTYITLPQIMTELKNMHLIAPIDHSAILQGLEYGKENNLIKETSQFCYSLPDVAFNEESIAISIKKIIDEPCNPDLTIDTSLWESSTTPNDLQLKAVKNISSNRISIITGGPGTGKTYVLKGIMMSIPANIKVALMAPTGKAAKRMAEALEGVKTPLPTTIHKFLKQRPEDEENSDIKSNYREVFSKSYLRRKSEEVPDLIIVDELSMVDIFLFSSLLAYCGKKPHYVFIGDVDQLPSIGPGLVLSDLINSDQLVYTRLTKNERQIEGSQILYNAYQVINGQAITLDNTNDWRVVLSDIPSDLARPLQDYINELIKKGYDPIKDIQVLSPQNRGTMGVNSLNSLLRNTLNPPSPSKNEIFNHEGVSLWREGDKVVSTKNIKLPSPIKGETYVVNGDTGIITNIMYQKNMHDVITKYTVTVDFDSYSALYIHDLNNKSEPNYLDYLSQAWAMTVHKSQGSEYPIIIISLSSEVYMELLNRPLFYTAITRGKEQVAVFGSTKSINKAISNTKVIKRLTNLTALLQ